MGRTGRKEEKEGERQRDKDRQSGQEHQEARGWESSCPGQQEATLPPRVTLIPAISAARAGL